jgi:DNA invertase Pin-like site-specific DNA recombinase
MNKVTALYCRCSTSEQETRTQVETMEKECLAKGLDPIPLDKFLSWCDGKAPRENLAVLIEDHASGKNQNREGFQWLLGQIRGGWIKEVWCEKVDRVGRNFAENISFFDTCEKREIPFRGLLDGIQSGDTNAAMMYRILSVCAAKMREDIVDRTRRGVRLRMNTCRKCGKHKDKHTTTGCVFEGLKQGGTVPGWSFKKIIRNLPRFWEDCDKGYSLRELQRKWGWNYRTVKKYFNMERTAMTRKEAVHAYYGVANGKDV